MKWLGEHSFFLSCVDMFLLKRDVGVQHSAAHFSFLFWVETCSSGFKLPDLLIYSGNDDGCLSGEALFNILHLIVKSNPGKQKTETRFLMMRGIRPDVSRLLWWLIFSQAPFRQRTEDQYQIGVMNFPFKGPFLFSPPKFEVVSPLGTFSGKLYFPSSHLPTIQCSFQV